jgi:predicted dehydrogenase
MADRRTGDGPPSSVSVRVAVLGAGFWARNAHVPALRALPHVELVACAGATLEEGRAFAAEHQIPAAYESLEQLLDEAEPNILAIVAPDDVHAPAATAALDRGIAVFCEKPLANDAATASALARLQDELSAVATVGFSFRFSPALQQLKRDVDTGVLGEPWFIELYEHNPQFHPLRGRPMNWKGDPARAAAGALFEYGSHIVDVARWLVGDVTAVSTSFGRVRSDAQLDDIGTLQLRFGGVATGILVSSWVLAGGFPGIRVRLHGSEGLGEAVLDESVGGEMYVRIGDDARVRERIDLERVPGGISGYTRRHYAALVDMFGGRAADGLPSLHDGAATQAILEAALQATERWADVHAS